jgi:hypothetical protein
MIAILTWIDGFGYDTCVIGIATSLEEARKKYQSQYNGRETRYQEVIPNSEQWFDWYDGKPLFNQDKKRGKRK